MNSSYPWDGLGHKVDKAASTDVWLKNTELDFTAKRSKVIFNTSDSDLSIGESDVLWHSNTLKQLGIVTSRYHVVQPKEIIQLYRNIVEAEGWTVEMVGTIDDGKRIWSLTNMGTGFDIAKGDRVDTYLLLSTTYDGKSGTVGKFLGIRRLTGVAIPMQNGKNAKIGKFSIPHKLSLNEKAIRDKLMPYSKVTANFKEQVKQLTKTTITDDEALRFIIDTLEKPGVDVDKLSSRQTNIVIRVLEMFQRQQIPEANSTAWGLLNALVEHIDYNVGINTNNRIRSAWFGLSETHKVKIMEALLNFKH